MSRVSANLVGLRRGAAPKTNRPAKEQERSSLNYGGEGDLVRSSYQGRPLLRQFNVRRDNEVYKGKNLYMAWRK